MTTKTFKNGNDTYEFISMREQVYLNGRIKSKFIVRKLIDNGNATFEYAPVYAKNFQQAHDQFFEIENNNY